MSGSFGAFNWPTTSCGGPFGSPCLPAGLVTGNNFDAGSATVNGSTFATLAFGDLLGDTGSSFVVTGPTITLSSPGSFYGPFQFQAQLCGTDPMSATIPRPCVVDLDLAGAGTVTIAAGLQPPDGVFVSEVTHTFQAIPEPGTLLAAAPMLFALACRLVRVRRAQKEALIYECK